MSFVIVAHAHPGKYLDGRDLGPNARLTMPPGAEACLVQATDNFAHHKKGDQWVEYVFTRSTEK